LNVPSFGVLPVCEKAVPWGGGGERDVANVEGRGRGVSLAAEPEDDGNGMSGTTLRLSLV
jgi:hypothetical protein